MTWKWQINGTPNSGVILSPATGSIAMFQIKEMLKNSVGFTHQRSSDGTTMSTGADQITSGASGANGFGNTSAYWIGRDPDGHEVAIQRGTTDVLYKSKISHSAHFTGGSPSATVMPSATDEQVRTGGGTDASPTFATAFGTNNTYHLHCGGDDASPYTWWYYCTATAAGNAHQAHGWFLNMQDGTFDYTDAAPYFFEFASTTAPSASNVNGTAIGGTWYKKGLAGEAWVTSNSAGNWAGFLFGSAQPIVPASTATQQLSSDPYSGADVGEPILMGRANNLAQPGRRGYLDPNAIRFPGTLRVQLDSEDTGGNAAWAQSTAYVKNYRVTANGNVYRCLVAGTSNSTGTGPSGTGSPIADGAGSLTWAFVEPVVRFSLFDVLLLRSPPGVKLT